MLDNEKAMPQKAEMNFGNNTVIELWCFIGFQLLSDIIGNKSTKLQQVLITGQTINKLLLGVPEPYFAT